MNILIIGSGGREHALAWKSAQDESVSNVFVCPGNAGTALENKVTNISLDTNNFEIIETFCVDEKIDLVIIGPEQPLVMGMADFLQSKGIKTFGPSQAAAQLEGSKTFSKDFFIKYGIPTAQYASFNDYDSSRSYLDKIDYPTVVKADGLAAGKGVIICNDKEEALKALESIFMDQAFGDAGNKVVIEEFLEGEEASFIAVVSKDKIIPLATSQDHKAVGEGDVGLNTGGMGAYSPAPIVDERLHKKIITEVMEPTMKGLISEGSPYLGFLYAGLMIKDGELKVLEFNCRFGDPETQPILIRLKSSLVELCLAAINEDMDSYDIAWTNKHACGVVIASEGYPESYESNKQVTLPVKSEQDMKLFHAGTKLIDDNVVTSGGRVFCATALGDDLKSAQSKAYNLVDSVTFDGAFHRRDIGFKGIK
ncbi:MAG: phosphoribosylamine--glycine ligase [SAR86 cluster bacterium]|jgi:phosphoribosylamine--glycine ligase|uniref:Phosphoribosylamine--glycine ligase n=2 Tax=SAR86 cluster bacterium TaxID=2030880 RepID=A0A520MVH0_9GAMM|nr:phosphoribosylamine--glycine ligase [Gammaproteobacteria bacterium]RZO25205.1 MAG: phosphoribosylamine--glycine ligase [SAR86 cluster bacterium]|tara:strand:- start:56 stop:1324 length:1269 start_codon:yes stop_codon:yes gene_type:complete